LTAERRLVLLLDPAVLEGVDKVREGGTLGVDAVGLGDRIVVARRRRVRVVLDLAGDVRAALDRRVLKDALRGLGGLSEVRDLLGRWRRGVLRRRAVAVSGVGLSTAAATGRDSDHDRD